MIPWEQDGTQSRFYLFDVLKPVRGRMGWVIPWTRAIKESGGVP
jgi:hypothetical protein